MSAYTYKVMIQEHPDLNPGFNVSMSTPTSTTDVAASVAAQANTSDQVILQILPSTKYGDFSGVTPYLAEAVKYPNIQAVYLYDELFYVDNQIQLGLYAQPLEAACDQVHAAGLHTTISILPEVVLNTGFQFAAADLNRFDVIAIDVYPYMGLDWSYADGCTYSNNLYTNMLYLAYTKLRTLGYTGLVWYIYQGFTIAGTTDFSKYTLQQQTIQAAPAIGITGLIPYAYKWFSGLEANILPGYSPIQSLADGSSY